MSSALDTNISFDDLKSRNEEVAERKAVAGVRDQLGVIIGGSLSEGLAVKLDRAVSIEELAVGRYVVARGRSRRFFCMVTDVALDATNPEVAKQPPDYADPFMAEIYRGTTTYGTVHLSPLLILENDTAEPKPVKTIPEHFTPVSNASQEEVDQVFGPEGERKVGAKDVHYFHIGAPLDMETVKITLNLERLVERSSGVFGKSGTGKTFLARLLLAGVIRENVAVNLIFDMHNEYGWEGSSEEISKVKGLKQIFPGRISIFTLDDESSRRRGSNPDFTVTIGYDQVEPEDLEMLAGLLNLSEPQVGAVYALYRKFGKNWLKDFLDDDWVDAYGDFNTETGKDVRGLKALAEDLGQGQQTLAALRRRFERMRNYSFLKPKALDNSVQRILDYIEQRKSVVLEFGRYGSDLSAYILVANFLTRRIHKQYVQKKEESFGKGGQEPHPLVITIEEAHKFLDPTIASNTIFGTIARELRKYNVTLFIVDQRPSGIDPEVMSQIGARVTMLLDDESDIKAVLSGVSGSGGLKEVLARLDTKEQALILGHAVPMPVVVQTRRYDLDFYKAMGFRDADERADEIGRLDQRTGRNPIPRGLIDMQPIKLLHTADLHIGMENYGRMDPQTGIHGRVMDFLRRLTDMIDYAIEEDVDLFVFAGDAYKMRDPNPTFQREFARRIKRLADAGVPVVLLVGNHDLPPVQRRATSISIFDTLSVPNVFVGADYGIRSIICRGQLLQVATAPYPLRQDHIPREEAEGKSVDELDRLLSERLTSRIMALADQARQDPHTPAILVGHFSVDEASHGSERNIMVGRDVAVDRGAALADPAWRYVALGHIHKHQSLNRDQQPPIIFSGSPERIDFGEEREPKGWVVATIGDGQTIWHFQEQHRLSARPFRTIEVDVRGVQDPTALVAERIAAAGDLCETVVRLRIVLDEAQETRLVDRDIRLALKDAYDVAAIQRDVQRQARDRLGGVSVEALTSTQMLERYLETRNIDPARAQILLQYAEDLIREVDSQAQ